MQRKIPASILMLLSLSALAGCGKSSASPYKAEFEQAQTAASSEYIKQVFSRALDKGTISGADYKESRQKLATCYREAGIEFSQQQDEYGLGLISFGFVDSGSDTAAAEDRCNAMYDGTGPTISGLYEQQVINPEKKDMDQLIADCLVRVGLVAEGFDAQDYREFIAANSATCSNGVCTLPDGTQYDASADRIPTENGLSGDFILPGGKSANSPEGVKCQRAPLLG